MSGLGDKRVVFPLTGVVTVRTISEIHVKLLNALTEADVVVLDTSAIGETDLTLVQLIESARQTASAAGKTVAIAPPVAPPLRDVLERGGFLDVADESGRFWRNALGEDHGDDSDR